MTPLMPQQKRSLRGIWTLLFLLFLCAIVYGTMRLKGEILFQPPFLQILVDVVAVIYPIIYIVIYRNALKAEAKIVRSNLEKSVIKKTVSYTRKRKKEMEKKETWVKVEEQDRDYNVPHHFLAFYAWTGIGIWFYIWLTRFGKVSEPANVAFQYVFDGTMFILCVFSISLIIISFLQGKR
jgi:hypothetical protein